MSFRPLSRGLGIDVNIVSRLSMGGIVTVKDLLDANPLLLMSLADLSLHDAKKLVEKVSMIVAPSPKSALELWLQQSQLGPDHYVATGIKDIDQVLGGGFRMGSVVEVAGAPGVGKTLLALSCCLQSYISSIKLTDNIPSSSSSSSSSSSNEPRQRKGAVVYFDTELKFDGSRLSELGKENFPDLFSHRDRDRDRGGIDIISGNDNHRDNDHDHGVPSSQHQHLNALLDNITIYRPKTCKELAAMIDELQTIVPTLGVSLIVIDSIAALVRKEGLTEAERDQFSATHTATLKRIGEKCGCVILITNQVINAPPSVTANATATATATDDVDPLGLIDRVYEDNACYRPAMGLMWHHCVSTRIILRRLHEHNVVMREIKKSEQPQQQRQQQQQRQRQRQPQQQPDVPPSSHIATTDAQLSNSTSFPPSIQHTLGYGLDGEVMNVDDDDDDDDVSYIRYDRSISITKNATTPYTEFQYGIVAGGIKILDRLESE